MFEFTKYKAAILKDNPTYERVKTSDLNKLTALLQKGGFTAKKVAAEMYPIPADKWKKYVSTRKYLIKEIPGLDDLVTPKPINFATKSLTALGGGNIKHDAEWESNTPKLADLATVLVREKVSWGNASTAASPYLDGAYRNAGQHFGVGNAVTSPGSAGNMSDTHDAKGAWSPEILKFKGPGEISYTCQQVYQYSQDRGTTWHDFPNSTYEIVRTASYTKEGKIKFAILKRSVPPNTSVETITNFVLL